MNAQNRSVVVKGCAGLGNRLVTVLAAIKYCERNNRTLVVDWSDGQFSEKGINAFEACFSIENTRYCNLNEIANWSSLSHASELFRKNKGAGLYDLYIDRYSRFFQKIPARFLPFPVLKKLKRRWQPHHGGNLLNSIPFGSDLSERASQDIIYFLDFLPDIDYSSLPSYIQVKGFLREKITDFASAHNLPQAVGIHVRNTDKKPTNDVNRLIAHIKEKHSGRPVFLSTDSTQVEELFARSFNSLILFPKTKPALTTEGLHQWALYNNENDLKYRIYEESVIEMFLLSACSYLYYQGNSTFSGVSRVYHSDKTNCYDWLEL